MFNKVDPWTGDHCCMMDRRSLLHDDDNYYKCGIIMVLKLKMKEMTIILL